MLIKRPKPTNFRRIHSILQYVYLASSLGAFGGVLYMVFTGRRKPAEYYGYKETLTTGQQLVRAMDLENTEMYRIKGMKIEKIENPFLNETDKQDTQPKSIPLDELE